MRLVPRTLGVRAFLLIALLIVASLAASGWLLRQSEREPRSQQLAQMITSAVNLTPAAVLSSDFSLRPASLADMVDHLARRSLGLLGLDTHETAAPEWTGLG